MRPDNDPVEGRILMTIRMKEWNWKRHQGRWRSRGWKARQLMMIGEDEIDGGDEESF